MGQVVKSKKKGRPSKVDLARRANLQSPAAERARRRILRRRSARYDSFIDFDDYLDESEEIEEEEEEEDRRKEEKVKLVHKLNEENGTVRGAHARDESGVEEEEEGNERKPLKKRRNNGGDESEAEEESENDDQDNAREERVRKDGNKGQESVPGTPSDHPNSLPLPDKKKLEFILHKLQKKDIYGVYAEPVDPEELPDYFEVIDHPMDFATVRKKLDIGSYSSLEQFESDVFLICSNAMQYNAPETVYHKQAHAIQELAKKKFEKLRIGIERSEKAVKSEQKTKSIFLAKKQIRKPLSRTLLEPLGSDFSSGATLATAGEVQNGSDATQVGGYEKSSNNTDGLVNGNFSLVDKIQEKAEDLLSAKGLPSKFGRKPSALDEIRRATYEMSNQPVVKSEMIFSTFESEIKQLVPVGLDPQYFYSRSLARFAATLGPVAWKAASNRIEQSLPSGCKFGRGWVGEYEPFSTPLLMLETRCQKESVWFTEFQCATDAQKGDITSWVIDGQKDDVTSRAQIAPAKEHAVKGSTSEAKPCLSRLNSGPAVDGKSSFASSAITKPSTLNPTYQQQNLPPRNFTESQKKVSKQIELKFPTSSYQPDADIVAEKQLPNHSKISATRPRELSRTVGMTQSVPSLLPETNELGPRGLPNGEVVKGSLNGRMISSSSESVPNQMAGGASYHLQGQEQGLTDPVEAMKKSAVKAQKLQKPSNQASDDNTSMTMPSIPCETKESSNAAVAAARAWMSIGVGGFRPLPPPPENSFAPKNQISAESSYNPTQQAHPQFPRVQGQFVLPAGMQLQSDKNFPFQAFMRPVLAGNEGQFPNRPMIFPQFVATDLSRFQTPSSWQGLSPHSQPKQKLETLPPDLNIVFQSPGSPVKHSSGVMVDSTQPDLALQL